jgi:hypothetical protein
MLLDNVGLVSQTLEYYSTLPGRYSLKLTELGPGIIFVQDHYEETDIRENDVYFDMGIWQYRYPGFQILTEDSELGKLPSWIFDKPIESLEEAVVLISALLISKDDTTLYDQPRVYPVALS